MKIAIFIVVILYNIFAFADSLQIVARAYNESIFNQDVVDRMRIFKIFNEEEYRKFFADNEKLFAKEIRDLLINEILLEEEAQKMRLVFSDAEVIQVLIDSKMFANKEDLERFSIKNRLNLSIWLRSVRFNLLMERLVHGYFRRQIHITDKEISDALIKKNREHEIYKIKRVVRDINIPLDANLSCEDFTNTSEFSFDKTEMSDELKKSLIEMQKQYFVTNDDKYVIILCSKEDGKFSLTDVRDELMNKRLNILIADFFEKLYQQHVYIN